MKFDLNIDVSLLREQRDWLLTVPQNPSADGLTNLLDEMLDQAEGVSRGLAP